MYAYLGGTCNELDCTPIKVGGYYDHIHILSKLSRKIAVMKLLEEIKKNSSKWIKTIDEKYSNFYWQDGYAIFSVNPMDIGIVVNYIEQQKDHH